MNSRDFALVSSAAAFGSLASALALRFYFSSSPLFKTRRRPPAPTRNGCDPDPFDPSKRKGQGTTAFPRVLCFPFFFEFLAPAVWVVDDRSFGSDRHLSWDDYFMAIAFLSAERSKDPNRLERAWSLKMVLFLALAIMDFQGAAQMTSFLGPRNLKVGMHWRQSIHKCHRPSSDFRSQLYCLLLNLECSSPHQICNNWRKILCFMFTVRPYAILLCHTSCFIIDSSSNCCSYVCHAEVNAILNPNHASAAGQKLYVIMFPCDERAKIIIQSGVSEVIFCGEKSKQFRHGIYSFSQTIVDGKSPSPETSTSNEPNPAQIRRVDSSPVFYTRAK